MKYRATFFNPRFLVFIVALACIAFITTGKKPAQKSQRGNTEELYTQFRIEDIRIENESKGLTIVSIKKVAGDLSLILRNDYEKTITGYEISVGIGTIQTELLAGDDEGNVILPGGIREEIYPFQKGIETEGIKVLAVIFDDKTTDGVPHYVKEIKQYRLGRRIQRQHNIRLLERALKSPMAEIPARIAEMEHDIGVPTEDVETLSPIVKFAIQDERSFFLRKIKTLIQSQAGFSIPTDKGQAQEFQRKLNRLAQGYAKTLSKL